MIDTGDTHNLVSVEEAKRLGVKLTKEKGYLKAVNSLVKPIVGIARHVAMQIGLWTRNVDLSMVHMDDFQVVLRLEFVNQVKAVPLPFISSGIIMEGPSTYMVPTVPGNLRIGRFHPRCNLRRPSNANNQLI